MPKLLLYCTKAKPYLNCDYGKDNHEEYRGDWNIYLANKQDECSNIVNGKIVAECDFEVEKIEYKHIKERDKFGILHNEAWYEYKGLNISNEDCDLLSKSNLTDDEMWDYLINKDGYAIHIKNLHIFDKPKELNDYYKFNGIYNDINNWKTIDKAPQNMMKVYNRAGECHILISVRPKYLVDVLNGNKTIEIRKKIVKGMM